MQDAKIFSKELFIMLLIAVFNLEKILKESEKLEEKYIEISANDSLKELNEKLIADNKTFQEIFDSQQRKKIDDEKIQLYQNQMV